MTVCQIDYFILFSQNLTDILTKVKRALLTQPLAARGLPQRCKTTDLAQQVVMVLASCDPDVR
jgi:hypothetical protein